MFKVSRLIGPGFDNHILLGFEMLFLRWTKGLHGTILCGASLPVDSHIPQLANKPGFTLELYAAVVLKRRWSCYIPIIQSQGRLQLVIANDLLRNLIWRKEFSDFINYWRDWEDC